MKTIFQKHTSKFVAGLFNSLGIIACVSLTSCSGENKVKQTENQVEKLKNGLKNVEFYKNLADDEDSLKAIADWLNNKNYGSDHILTENELREIFQYDSSKLNEVAEKLGVELTVFEEEPDDEKKKEINEWLNKLNSRNDDDFNALDNDLKEKVAQKFIDNNIDITNDDGIATKLAGFINEVKDEKKQNEISIKVVGEGKVTITKVADSTPTDFVFDTIDVFEKFVGDLKGKEITNREVVELSFAFEGESVKICGHQTGFDVTVCFGKFLNRFEVLTRFKNLKVSNLTLGVTSDGISLNSVACDDEFYKGSGFWNLVKDHADLFGITDENKFEIEKNDKVKGKINGKDEATVTINGFESSLLWKWVVNEEGKTLVANSGWNNIFKLKDKEESAKEVTVEFENGKCTCKEIKGYEDGVVLKDLAALEKLVEVLKEKTVKIDENKIFSLAFEGKKVKVCGHSDGFEVMKESDFEKLLKCVADLKGEGKAIGADFKIALTMEEQKVLFDGKEIDSTFVKSANFWKTVKDNIGLVVVDPLLKISKATTDSLVKVGALDTLLPLTTVCDDFENGSFKDNWNSIFEK